MFVEGGEARITEPAVKGAAPAPACSKSGEFYTRKADQKGAVARTPAADLRRRAAEDISRPAALASRALQGARGPAQAPRRGELRGGGGLAEGAARDPPSADAPVQAAPVRSCVSLGARREPEVPPRVGPDPVSREIQAQGIPPGSPGSPASPGPEPRVSASIARGAPAMKTDRQVQPRVHRGLSARACRRGLRVARAPPEERARRDRAERAPGDGIGARQPRLHLEPGGAAPADADEVQLPAAVGSRLLRDRGVQHRAQDVPRVRLQGGDAESHQPAQPRERLGSRHRQPVPQRVGPAGSRSGSATRRTEDPSTSRVRSRSRRRPASPATRPSMPRPRRWSSATDRPTASAGS